jgi:hypothetical protein
MVVKARGVKETELVTIPDDQQPDDWRWTLYEALSLDVLDFEIDRQFRAWVQADTKLKRAAEALSGTADELGLVRDLADLREKLEVSITDTVRAAHINAKAKDERAVQTERWLRGHEDYQELERAVQRAESAKAQAVADEKHTAKVLAHLEGTRRSKDYRVRFLTSLPPIPRAYAPDEDKREPTGLGPDLPSEVVRGRTYHGGPWDETETKNSVSAVKPAPKTMDPVADWLSSYEDYQFVGPDDLISKLALQTLEMIPGGPDDPRVQATLTRIQGTGGGKL